MSRYTGLFLSLLFLTSLNFISCNFDNSEPIIDIPTVVQNRGDIVSTTLIESFTLADIQTFIDDNIGVVFGSNFNPQYGVDVYRVVYLTNDARGENLVEASGALVVSQSLNDTVPLMSYQHGTSSRKIDVPSSGSEQTQEVWIGILIASEGGVMGMADYLGLGLSEGIHPYVHAESEASACVDMLRATRTKVAELGITLSDQLFLVGYSQGGQATMALHKALEELHSDEFTVTASAPMAGPYDMSGTMADEITSENEYSVPGYLPFMLLGYNHVYEMYESPSDFLKEPYATILPPLFDGRFGMGTINDHMPAKPKEIILGSLLDEFESNPNHLLRQKLKENDLYEWTPKAKVRLFHCQGDEQVPYNNSVVTLAEFQSRGVDVSLYTADEIPGLNFSHGDCALPSLVEAHKWFNTIKE